MTDQLADKSIVVTGAASGFGRLLSEEAAARGARITCADIDGDALPEVVAGIRAAGDHFVL